MTELTLNISRSIKAPAETLFNAWLDPAILARFMIPGNGMSEATVTNDPHEGGHFSIMMNAPGQQLPHTGKYLEIKPHSKIVFTWISAHSIDGSVVTLDFVPDADGTRIDLSQVKFFSEEMRDNHTKGWTTILSALEAVVVPAAVS